MLNIVNHLPQKYCENILVAHNDHDMVYQVRGFQLHSIHLTSMQVDNNKDNCKKDIHIWDLRDGKQQPSVQTHKQLINAPFTCCSISPDGSLVCCGTEVCRVKKSHKKKRRKRHDSIDSSEMDEDTAHLIYWDTRNLSSPLGSIKDFHSDDIVDVKFDPTSVPGYLRLMDCSEDGLVCLFDMKAASASDENPLLYMFNSESVTSSCGWLLSSNNSTDCLIGVYCTTIMRSNVKVWPIHPSMLLQSNKELNLSEKEQKQLNDTTKLWNSKFIDYNSLKGHNFFSVIIQDDKFKEFLLLGEYDNQDCPAIFYSNPNKPIWNISCLGNNINNQQVDNTNFNLQSADFLHKSSDNHKKFCFMIGSQSTVLCSYEISTE
ncbi:unnamed protein product [Heterobilharzia americana]|nr:unnamed protein product [Heterobilharzia americana]